MNNEVVWATEMVRCKSITGLIIWLSIMFVIVIVMYRYSLRAEEWARQNPDGNDLSIYHYIAIGSILVNLSVFSIGFVFLFFDIISVKLAWILLIKINIFIIILMVVGIIINLKIHS